MTTKIKEMKCQNCGQISETKQKGSFSLDRNKSFLGFPKMTCPKCNHKNIYPLGNGYRTFYTILIILGVILFFVAIGTGSTFTPSILLIAAIIAMFKDSSIRKKMKQAELREQVAVAPVAPTTDKKDFKSYCHQCGTGLQTGTKFCPSCGANQK